MSESLESGGTVVTRSYQSKDGSRMRFSVGAPYPTGTEHGPYKCDYLLELGTRRIARTVEGMDGLHVLLLSLSSIRQWITESGIVDPLNFRWDGADEWGELGFFLPD